MARQRKINAKSIEKSIRKSLVEITSKDEMALKMLSQCIDYHNRCVANIEEEGILVSYTRANGTEATKENPHINIMLRLQGQISKYLTEFKMTPKSRERGNKEETTDDEDPIQALLKKLGGNKK